MSDDDNQTLVPASFIALHSDARGRLTATRATVAARYELCEDMATLLGDHCRNVQLRDGLPPQDVLDRCRQGLLVPEADVTPAEAEWIAHRIAELLDWPWRGEGGAQASTSLR